MKKLIYVLLLFSISLNAQSWNSIITTTINVSNVEYIENHADKNGINVVTFDSNNDIKYYLISSSGTTIRSATISTNGEFPNIVGDASSIYVVYREGSNIRVKKTTDAGASWSQRADLGIGSNPCSGIDATINADGIHTVWSIGDSYGQDLETNYKKHTLTTDNWVDYKNITDYSSGYGMSPTVAVSPSRVHVGYNSKNFMPDEYYFYSVPEMSRTKYGTTWQTQQQVTDESGRGKIFAGSSKLYDFYYKPVADMGAHHDLYFKYKDFSSTTWSSSTLLEGYSDVTTPLTICETANGNIHTYTHASGLVENIIISGAINSTSAISEDYGINSISGSASYNDIYVNWSHYNSAYLQLRQFDEDPQIPQNLSVAWYSDHPKLTWTTNEDTDMKEYKIWKYVNGSAMVVATVTHSASSSTHTWTDNSVTPAGKLDPIYTYYYKVKAVDNANNESLYSNQVSISGTGVIWKINGEEDSKADITSYALDSNYPNPFNPTTQISYQLPENSFVNLVVYNTIGQKVAELVNQEQTSGKYTVKFDASNLPSGVYIYKLQAGEFSDVKKMLLTK